MNITELRKIVKQIITVQGGKFYNFNTNNLVAAYGVSSIDVQNALNYFSYSPQQTSFRAATGWH